jgi:hypothetical protein
MLLNSSTSAKPQLLGQPASLESDFMEAMLWGHHPDPIPNIILEEEGPEYRSIVNIEYPPINELN